MGLLRPLHPRRFFVYSHRAADPSRKSAPSLPDRVIWFPDRASSRFHFHSAMLLPMQPLIVHGGAMDIFPHEIRDACKSGGLRRSSSRAEMLKTGGHGARDARSRHQSSSKPIPPLFRLRLSSHSSRWPRRRWTPSFYGRAARSPLAPFRTCVASKIRIQPPPRAPRKCPHMMLSPRRRKFRQLALVRHGSATPIPHLAAEREAWLREQQGLPRRENHRGHEPERSVLSPSTSKAASSLPPPRRHCCKLPGRIGVLL